MRVGYVTGQYPRSTDTFIQREVAGLRAASVHVDTFAVRAPDDAEMVGQEQLEERGRTTYLLAGGAAPMALAHLRLLFSSPERWASAAALAWGSRQPGARGAMLQLAYFAEAGLLAGLARRRKLDHLHNHFGDSSGSVTMLAAGLAGIPFSMTVHGPDVFADGSRWRLDVKCVHAAFVVCISHFAMSQVMSVAPAHTWSRLKIVHCGVEPALYGPPTDQPGRFRLLTVGRLAPVKGIMILLEAVARVRPVLPHVVLDIVGSGPDRSRLEARVEQLGLAEVVRFLGAQSQAAVRAELRTADVFVLASFAEGLPVVLMEALASQVPVVATNIMGVPELVENGVTGRLVAPADVSALADALHDMAQLSAKDRRALGDRGRRIVERDFNSRTEAAKLADLFRGPVDSDGGAPGVPSFYAG